MDLIRTCPHIKFQDLSSGHNLNTGKNVRYSVHGNYLNDGLAKVIRLEKSDISLVRSCL